MGRNYYPDYKYLEGLLQWYFGSNVSLTYRCQPGADQSAYPLVAVNGVIVARGKIPADIIVEHLEGMGLRRLDQDI